MNDLQLYFRYKCEQGLKERGRADQSIYKERLEYEIQTITKMGYCGYFLIVADMLAWAKDHGILRGIGRGSAAGSLATWALQITHIDPIKYGLYFERFLNPARVSAADIDCDYNDLRREEVINYVINKYGADRVSHIGTFGTMKAKAAIRAAANVLGYPYDLGDKLAKLVLEPIAGKVQPLEVCYESVPELKKYRGYPSREQEVLKLAERFEDRLRSFSTHASGIVIAADPIAETIPLYPGKDKVATTQFEMNTVEKLGFIKFDFLGLSALTTIQYCIDLIKENKKIEIDIFNISLDDKQVFDGIRSGDVTGVFQMEGSSGMRDLVINIQPRSIEDLSLLTAIFRPGPLSSNMLKNFLKVRAGEAEPEYIVPELKPILSNTDGMLIYQEQVMEICKQLAGYSLAEADLMRKAIGKKNQEEMDKQKEKFVEGIISNNIQKEKALLVWETIVNFASYGFNKSHSVSYSVISYQMAFLKTHYPVEFMCACLISNSNETDKIIEYIDYCKKMGINILPPSINESEYSFSLAGDGKSIRFGLGAIKNLGKPVETIIQERKKNGAFSSILDFAARVDLTKINKRKIESLVLAGAFDELGNCNRESLLAAIKKILEHKDELKAYNSKQLTFFKKRDEYNQRQILIEEWNQLSKEEQKNKRKEGKKKPGTMKEPISPEQPPLPFIPTREEMPIQYILSLEKELIGYYVSGHPLDNIKEKGKYTISQIREGVLAGELKHKDFISIVAIPSIVKVITTKKNKQKMAYVTLEDKTGTIQTTILPKPFSEHGQKINTDTPIMCNGNLEVIERDSEVVIKIIINSIFVPKSVQSFKNQPISIVCTEASIKEIANKIKSSQGIDFRVKLFLQSKNLWYMGTFNCGGNKMEFEKQLKEML